MVVLEIIGYTLAVVVIVSATFLLFIGGPRFRRRDRRHDGDGPAEGGGRSGARDTAAGGPGTGGG